MLPVLKTTKNPFYSHEEKLIEYHAIVETDGTVISGGSGLTISKTTTGIYQIVIDDIHPISSADLANTSMAAESNGTGVTKTCALFANALVSFPVSTFAFAFPEKLELNASGQLQFRVKTVKLGALADNRFAFKAVVSCDAYGRN